jgi:hypothetical protein
VPAISFGTALGAGVGVVDVAAVAPEAVAVGTVFGAAAGLTLAPRARRRGVRRRHG